MNYTKCFREIEKDNFDTNIINFNENNFANNIILNFIGNIDKLDNIFQTII